MRKPFNLKLTLEESFEEEYKYQREAIQAELNEQKRVEINHNMITSISLLNRRLPGWDIDPTVPYYTLVNKEHGIKIIVKEDLYQSYIISHGYILTYKRFIVSDSNLSTIFEKFVLFLESSFKWKLKLLSEMVGLI